MEHYEEFVGLTDQQVLDARRRYGWNRIEPKKPNRVLQLLKRAWNEPMLLLLIATSVIYFLTGAYAEAIFMLAAVMMVSLISFYQEGRSKDALAALEAYTQAKTKVIRNARVEEISSEGLVPGDHFIVEEGVLIPADGVVAKSNDFSVNESIITGESLPVSKVPENEIFQGTQVMSGRAVCVSTRVGAETRMGQIGEDLKGIREEKSPLEIQIGDFVRKMAIAGFVIFSLILLINFYKSEPFKDSLLRGLTLAMSILPEEIPVAFATFMALGARRLMQKGIIVKQTQTIETLGSASVICVDKTGTLTKNEMTLASVYDHSTGRIASAKNLAEVANVITVAMWASEPVPFDPMEKALHKAYEQIMNTDLRREFKLVHEYPLSGTPPFMTHVFRNNDGAYIIAAKGAPEAMIRLCDLSPAQKRRMQEAFDEMAQQGFRVLGVADAGYPGNPLPSRQDEFKFTFKGLVAFYDPPKDNISEVLESFYDAGLNVKLITGDNSVTTNTIARQINFRGSDKSITGAELMKESAEDFYKEIRDKNIFCRMFPEAKLAVIETLKQQNIVVAMTGDGVNDAPALKAAHIGIAMGKKGSEVAKQSSALILVEDDLQGLVHGVAMGRQIYSNLKKAVQYIVSIHIPIILIVFVPLMLGWVYPTIFTPVHIIFLELIMGPTCSIIYENEPMEKNVMEERPRQFRKTFFRASELVTSLVQGLMITAGLAIIYRVAVLSGATLPTTTSMVFVTLITSNILLTLVNRSFIYPIAETIRYKNRLIPLVIGITVILVILIFGITSLREFFALALLSWTEVMTCLLVGIVSVVWFEGYKWIRRYAKSPLRQKWTS